MEIVIKEANLYDPLTKRQKEIFNFISFYINTYNTAPSLNEIKRYFRLKSISTVHEHINQLYKKGYLDKQMNQKRSLRIINPFFDENHFAEIPVFGKVSSDKIQKSKPVRYLLINKELVDSSGKYYALKIKGNSLIEEGFFDSDILIVREQKRAKNKDLVLAFVQAKIPTIRRYYKEKNRIRLQPLNPKASPRFYKKIEIQGKIVGLIRVFDKNHPWKKL